MPAFESRWYKSKGPKWPLPKGHPVPFQRAKTAPSIYRKVKQESKTGNTTGKKTGGKPLGASKYSFDKIGDKASAQMKRAISGLIARASGWRL